MFRDWSPKLYSDKVTKELNFPYNYDDNLIVSREFGTYRQFTSFKSYTHFQQYNNDTLEPERCFYEVILGKKKRKPYFDIDIDMKEYTEMNEEKSDEMVTMLVENINDLLYKYKPKIIVFTSHRPGKLSYHIVVDGVCLVDNDATRDFAEKVISVEMRNYVDTKVYTVVQQMRIVGSVKHGKNNKKIVNYELSENFYIPKELKFNKFRRDNYILQSSLISFTGNCEFVSFKEGKRKKKKQLSKGNANEHDVDDAMKLLYDNYTNFEISRVLEKDGNVLVVLRSNNSYHCKIHDRIHDSENAYITIQGIYRNVWFDCRRIEQHEVKLAHQSLGFLGIPIQKKLSPTSYNFTIGN